MPGDLPGARRRGLAAGLSAVCSSSAPERPIRCVTLSAPAPEIIDTKSGQIRLDADGILRVLHKQGQVEHGLPEAEENTRAIVRLTAGRAWPTLIDLRGMPMPSSTAIRHYKSEELSRHQKALAVLIG